jgi:transposase
MQYIEGQDRYQYQMPGSLDETIQTDNPIRVIDTIINSIVKENKERFVREREREAGRPRYQDAVMLKLYLYGYFNGISSSRKLEVETQRNKELIWLLEGLSPDHWTISNYRKEKGDDIKYVTKKFREFLKDKGYIKLKTVAIDGSKVKAYTNREMLTLEKIEERLTGLDKKIEDYLKRITETDQVDDVVEEVGEDTNENNGKRYINKIIELQKRVEELQSQKEILERENRKHISSADTEARLMRSRDGMVPGYNVQIAVDAEHKMIADSEVITDETDNRMIPEMIESIKEELGKIPKEVIADNGYNAPDKIEAVENKEEEIKVYVAQSSTTKDREEIKFEYDEEKDEYKCPEGKPLVLISKNKIKNKSVMNVYQGRECEGCPLRSRCTKSKKGRIVHRYLNQKWRDDYKERMQSKTGKAKMSLRRQLVEHPFGTIKYLMGKIPLKLRGKEKVGTEINLYTTVYNLKRLINIEPCGLLIEKIQNYAWTTA